MTSTVCNVCAQLDIENGWEWSLYKLGGFHITIQDLQELTHQCPTDGCKLLLRAVFKCFPDASTTDGIVPCFQPGVFEVGHLGELQMYFKMDAQDPIWPAFLRSTHHEDLTSHDSLDSVRDRLVECLDTHHSCRIPIGQEAYMPTRVLDVGLIDDGRLSVDNRAPVYLVDAIEITGDRTYACLSHRWNTSRKNIITEKATHEKHESGIEFQQLGLAYQDTVHILRRLGVRYLWIDSLCIIQDDKDDWETESKMMAKVYSSALFTLARHCDATTSLVRARHPAIVVSETISPPVYARAIIDHVWDFGGWASMVKHGTLLRRGWVYQERLLSPRVIHLTEHEISWECQSVSDCQCKHGESRARSSIFVPKIWHTRALAPGGRDATKHKDAIAKRWRAMVGEYSGLQLTKQTDRLPAIRGCAEQIYAQLKDSGHIKTDFDGSYSFGLWEHCLVSDMAWRSWGRRESTLQRSPQLFPVPTWSWVPVNATVLYPDQGSDRKKLHAQANLLRTRDDARGRHTSTYIILTAQTIPARLKLERRSAIGDSDHDSTRQVSIHITPDYLQCGSTSTSLHRLNSRFEADFEFRSANWDEEAWYDITIVRLAGFEDGDSVCLLLWRYGKSVPGSGVHRETKDNIPIYQRIGMLNAWRTTGEGSIDWSKAEKTTIAIE